MKKGKYIIFAAALILAGILLPLRRVDAADFTGSYYLVSGLSESFVLDVAGGRTADRTNVQIYRKNGTGAQQFRIERAGAYYRIVNIKSGRALDVAGAGKQNKTNVQIYKWNKTKAQLWEIRQEGNGYVSFINAGSGKALDVSGGRKKNRTNVWQYTVNHTAAQKWKLLSIADAGKTEVSEEMEASAKQKQTTPGIRSGAVYTFISAVDRRFALDVKGAGTGNGVNVQAYRVNGTKAQLWKIIWTDGFYRIINTGSGRALDVAGGKTASRTNVQQWRQNGTKAQLWRIEKNPDGTYTIISALHKARALDLSAARAANGQNIQIYAANGTKAQKWVITEYGTAVSSGVGQDVHTHVWKQEKVLVQAAYDEVKDVYEYHTYCYTCGAFMDDWTEEEIVAHGKAHRGAGEEWGHWGYGKVKTGTGIVHHSAVYKTVTKCSVCGTEK